MTLFYDRIKQLLLITNNMQNNFLLRLFLGLTFLSAGIYRIFNWHQAVLEFSRFGISSAYYLIILMIILEVAGGLLLILNIRTKEILLAFIVFIIIALISAFLVNGREIVSGLGELFTFNPSPTDSFLHFTYLIILIYLFNKK